MPHQRLLTAGEIAILRSVYGRNIDYWKVRVHNHRWMPVFPGDRAMAPNGEIYFPGGTYRTDFAAAPLDRRALLVHEGVHLYQYYGLGWSVIARGPFARDYDYALVPGKPFTSYGLEEMGMIAQHYYILRNGGTLGGRYGRYRLRDYSAMLPLP